MNKFRDAKVVFERGLRNFGCFQIGKCRLPANKPPAPILVESPEIRVNTQALRHQPFVRFLPDAVLADGRD